MSDPYSRHRNADGTINGPSLFAAITGLSRDEIAWTFGRLKQLIQVEKVPKDEAKRRVGEEAKARPWERA